jgi:predicted hydrolase (HD superfamily)
MIVNDPPREGGGLDSLSADNASGLVRRDALWRGLGTVRSVSSRIMSKRAKRKHRARGTKIRQWGIPMYGVPGPSGK